MDIKDYTRLSEKTLSNQFNVDEKMQKTLHAVMGILTETDELDDNMYAMKFDSTNALEEVGDVMWYIAIILREYPEVSPYKSFSAYVDSKHALRMLIKNSHKMLDLLKKKIFYNKEMDMVKFENYLSEIFTSTESIVDLYGINIEDVMQKNIDKLVARYGDKFSSEAAINRDLGKEYGILGGA